MGKVTFAVLAIASCAARGAQDRKSDDPRRPPAIATESVPAIPAEIHERLLQYQNVRSASFLDWAPDGRSILVSTRFGNTSQLHRVREPGGRREQLTFYDEPVAGGRWWDEGTILLSIAKGGDEQWQILRHDVRTGRSALLTDGTSRHQMGPVNRAGTRMVVSINRPKERDTDLYLFDPKLPATPELLLKAEGKFWSAVDWSPDDTKLLLSQYVSANESTLHVMDVASRKLTPIPIPGGGRAAHDAAKFAPDGRSAYLSSDAKGEFKVLAQVALDTMEYRWLTEDLPWDVTDLEVSPDGKTVAFVTNEDGASRLTFLRDGRRVAAEIPMGIIGGMEFSPDSARLAFTLSRPDAPGDVYTLEGGRLTRWTFSEAGGLDPATFVLPERIAFESFDGRKIPAYAYRPKAGPRKAPVIVSIHGGPEGQSRPSFSSLTQFYVAELGCAVLVPNVRGSTGYGKTFVALDNAEKREDSVKDIGALLDWIAKQPDLDASRVAVIGGSYGGYMVLASLVHFGDRIRAGVDIVGIANFNTFLASTSAYRQDLRRVEYGDERDAKMKEVFDRISPANHAERIRSALLVAHGKNDPRVPFGEAVQIARKVREAGQPVWTVYAENEGHGFGRKENRDYLNAVIVAFFQERLLK
jgi:dipeptidyl aminopeptidase/acylaminoacyl peptidase